jgi:hypothetical protein
VGRCISLSPKSHASLHESRPFGVHTLKRDLTASANILDTLTAIVAGDRDSDRWDLRAARSTSLDR